MNRTSSTPQGAYDRCPRDFWYQNRPRAPKPVQPNAAMAFGTVFHAFMEFRGHRGRWPTKGEFTSMTGTYDDPIDSIRRFPKVYAPALHSAQWLYANRPDLTTFDDDVEFEKPLDDFGLMLGDGVTASGYLDVFLPSRRTIRDYKTRSSFSYCPRTLDDFMQDSQQCYYGAAVAKAMGWDSIRVEHVNILRPEKGGPDVLQVGVELPIAYLEECWEKLDLQTIPDMVQLLTLTDERDVPVSRGACWRYGKCQHFDYCGQTHAEIDDNPLAFFNSAVADATDPFDGVF